MNRLVCVVADKNIEAAISALLNTRKQSLKLVDFPFDIVVHPQRDPGCYNEGPAFLKGLMGDNDCYGLLIFDQDWQGNKNRTAIDTEAKVREQFRRIGIVERAEVVVIEPEIEAWIWNSSPHVCNELGWDGNYATLRHWLSEKDLWPDGELKPSDPKAAVEAVLLEKNIPRSSAIYRKLAQKVSLRRCQDAAFRRLTRFLSSKFSVDGI